MTFRGSKTIQWPKMCYKHNAIRRLVCISILTLIIRQPFTDKTRLRVHDYLLQHSVRGGLINLFIAV
jgi:hypothetical protein